MIPAIFDQWSQSSKKVLYIFNLQSKQFDYLSTAFEFIWEINRDLILKNPGQLFALVEEDDREAVGLRFEKACQGNACEIEFGLEFPDKRLKQVKVDAQPIADGSGTLTHLMGYAEDVTQQAQYREHLLEFGRKKNNVLQVVAHDLQGPLAIMKGVTSLLSMDHAEGRYEEIANYTELIDRAYEDCLKLIKEVLQDEHIKSAGTPVKRKRFDAVEKTRQTVEYYIKSQVVKVPILVESPEDKIIVELDEMKFTQILNNLITNSIKFTPANGKISLVLNTHGSDFILTHTDTGIGIPEEIQPYLFDKYSNKARRNGLNGEEPNGIGLSIIKDLVEVQGGRIALKSQENKGTTFTLTFPLLA
ncbi:HAMP domain-containing histidine kinase [Adhaeribacter swui]|uniref:histidine kinase n=1 Tax=Adhaeribacter swui TaxID=2086471 RepID=A0A7G7GER2_9BACT|nr:HAMP domain-containing sensor histidine kinase [Adhaeribacter swui]QNF35646.1 HAMP domain-containing histidine kinase [Adhaeribacter swui]